MRSRLIFHKGYSVCGTWNSNVVSWFELSQTVDASSGKTVTHSAIDAMYDGLFTFRSTT